MKAFVVVEGVPGVGKTTLARGLADHLEGEVMRLPESFRVSRDAVNREGDAPPLARFLYYTAGAAHMSSRVEMRCDHAPLVGDRYLPSVLALAEVDGGFSQTDVDDMSAPYRRQLVVPDLTIVLSADHDALRRRLQRRDRNNESNQEVHHRAADDESFANRWAEAIHRWAEHLGTTELIDTTHLAANAVLERATAAIEATTATTEVDR